MIRLVTYVRVPRDSHKRKITRRAVFARDGWQCMYCGAADDPDRRPRDPALQGRLLGLGQHRRVVRAVQPPQGRPLLPHQVNMHPRVKPRSRRAHIFIQLASPTIPATWRQYLPQAACIRRSPAPASAGTPASPHPAQLTFAGATYACKAPQDPPPNEGPESTLGAFEQLAGLQSPMAD